VIPIVISMTVNVHTRTLAEKAQLVSLKENPLDTLTYKFLPHQAQTIAMTLHIHAQEWLTLMSKISRNNLTQRPTQKKTQTTPYDNKKGDNTRYTTPTTVWKVQLKTSERDRLGRGEGFRLEVPAYKGLGVIEPHMNGPIAQPA
jgi:hypothetical protein